MCKLVSAHAHCSFRLVRLLLSPPPWVSVAARYCLSVCRVPLYNEFKATNNEKMSSPGWWERRGALSWSRSSGPRIVSTILPAVWPPEERSSPSRSFHCRPCLPGSPEPRKIRRRHLKTCWIPIQNRSSSPVGLNRLQMMSFWSGFGISPILWIVHQTL